MGKDKFAWDKTVMGTCSICAGAVVMPRTYYSVVPPIPACIRCGATPRNPYGGVISMERNQPSLIDTLMEQAGEVEEEQEEKVMGFFMDKS